MIIKCKMCGGDLRIIDNSSVCECEYCGTRQTVPKADDEKKMTLFTRAARLLRNCEFDKASGVFETVVADFPEEAEAYWGLVLCKYGIEYVDDPATGKKVPTCHRSSFESVLDDPNFEQACEYADAIARRVYRDEARQIETLRKGIIEVSGKEDPYDIFISYKETDENNERTLDSVIAQDIYNEVTEKGYRVFFSRISLESKLGTEYEPYIFAALNSAKVMLVVGTDYENFDAVWVKNEWSRFLKLIASGQKKTLIPVFKNMDAYDMPKEFSKLAAQDMGKVGAMQDLIRGVEKLIPKKKAEANVPAPAAPQRETVYVQQSGGPNVTALLKRGYIALDDEDWEKAGEFFDQVLSMDAECSDAWLGMAMAEDEYSVPENYIDERLDVEATSQEYALPQDEEHIREAKERYTVEGYLDGESIEKLYQYTKSCRSTVDSLKEQKQQAIESLKDNRNIARALEFADSNSKVTVIKEKLTRAYDQMISEARKEAEAEEARIKREYTEFLKETDRKAEEMHRDALARKEQDEEAAKKAKEKRKSFYDQACDLQKTAERIEDYQRAIAVFQSTNGFQDSEKRIGECQKCIEELQEAEKARLEQLRRESAYRSAQEKQKTASSVEAFKAAIWDYRKAEGYFDSKDQITFCENRIRELEEQEREDAARKAAAKRKRTTAIFALLAVIAVAAYFVMTKVVIPGRQYDAAMALYENGKYNEAITAFTALGDYKDSSDKLKEVRAAQKEEQYQRAITLFEDGKFDEAITAFTDLGSFKDSAEKLEEVKENQYNAARKLLNEGSYADAYSAFKEITGYKDVDTLLSTDKNLMLAPYGIVGSTVRFGSYEQDNKTSNGKEDIEWIVLNVQGEKSLLISKYALDAQAYNSTYTDITWEKCTLRGWLNSTFLSTAFNADEKTAILTTSVDNSKSQGYSGYNTDGGNDTEDQIFLLSYAEAWKYFTSDNSRTCEPTAYAKAQGAHVDLGNNCWWWLRSPGNARYSAASVLADGSRYSYGVDLGNYGVRPALWINLESDIF